jgi:hypothetical protein
MAEPAYLADYVTVAERLAAFVAKYPDGRISTKLVSSVFDPDSGKGLVIVAAEVFKNRDSEFPDGTGLDSMPIPGVTNFTRGSEVANTETSAVGRALAMIGFMAKNQDGSARISSKEEIAAKSGEDTPTATGITAKQRGMLMSMAKAAGMDPNTPEGKVALQAVTLAATGKHNSRQLTNADVDLLVLALEVKKYEE